MSDNDIVERLRAEVATLRAAIGALVDEIDGDHQPEWASDADRDKGRDPIWCRTCGAGDGGWPCVHRLALDALREVAK